MFYHWKASAAAAAAAINKRGWPDPEKKTNNISTYSWCSMITLCTSEFNVFRVVFLFLFLKTLNEKQQEKSKTNPCRKKRLKSDAKARKTENKPERLNQCVNLPQSASHPINQTAIRSVGSPIRSPCQSFKGFVGTAAQSSYRSSILSSSGWRLK